MNRAKRLKRKRRQVKKSRLGQRPKTECSEVSTSAEGSKKRWRLK